MTQNDSELLQQYVARRSEKAFAELVARHVDLVYSAALRRVNGDTHAAEDVAQGVFETLASKAARLTGHTSLAGWLHTTTRYVASNNRRSERRRLVREQEAHAMNHFLQPAGPPPDWAQLRPVIDDALGELDDEDREAVLLKFFQRCPLAEIGARLGIKENTARMRIERSLEKLRVELAKRGITSTAAALALSLAAHAVSAAPAGLATRICQTAPAGAGVAAGAGLATLLGSTAAKIALAALVVTVVAVPVLHRSQTAQSVPAQNVGASATAAVNTDLKSNAAEVTVTPVTNQRSRATTVAGLNLQLYLVDPKTSKPLAGVRVDERCWSPSGFNKGTFQSDKDGFCEIAYPANTTQLELTTREDGYADTRLEWRPDHGDVIPDFYTVNLAAPVLIGGQVVDDSGRPVAGAKVGWNHEEAPAASTSPESHEFGWIEVTTDSEGRWQINRIAPEMIRRLYGGAKHPDHVDTPLFFVAREPAMEQALREGTYVFHLGAPATIQGTVKDPDDQPVSGAKVLVGYVSASDRRETTTGADGGFVLAGCKPGENLLTASAPGFANTTREINITTNSSPFDIMLQKGGVLRLLIRNQNGEPVPGANAWLDTINQGPANSPHYNVKRTQVDFNEESDSDGRLIWSNAPEGELKFQFSAAGYMQTGYIYLTADGREHVITLNPALVISGAVQDAESGEPIPHFRIGIGWPQADPIHNQTNGQWSSIGRFWPEFSGGQYRQTMEEAALGGVPNPGYVLKFEAEGYSPFVSRVIAADEGQVQLDVSLHRASSMVITVLDPDGRRAAGADVGLVGPGAQLRLLPGGFSRDGAGSAALLATDDSGCFIFTTADTISRIIVADAVGYAEATPAELTNSPTLTLQPWGRVEGTCFSGGQPVAGREYLFNLFGDEGNNSIDADFTAYKVESGADGKFTLPKVPPGKHYLVRLIRTRISPGGMAWMHGLKTEVMIQPGETTPVTFGDTSYTVTANVQWPGRVCPTNGMLNASLHTPMPPLPTGLHDHPDLIRQFYQSPEYQALAKSSQHYPMAANADGSLAAEDVPPGNYTLSVMVMLPQTDGEPGRVMSGHDISVTVPSDPPTGKLDAGTIELVEMPVRMNGNQ